MGRGTGEGVGRAGFVYLDVNGVEKLGWDGVERVCCANWQGSRSRWSGVFKALGCQLGSLLLFLISWVGGLSVIVRHWEHFWIPQELKVNSSSTVTLKLANVDRKATS